MTVYLADSSHVTVLDSLKYVRGTGSYNRLYGPGEIDLYGDLIMANDVSVISGGTAWINLVDSANQNIISRHLGVDDNKSKFPNVRINRVNEQAQSKVYLKGNISISGSWEHLAGTTDVTTFSSTVCFKGTNHILGDVHFDNVYFSPYTHSYYGIADSSTVTIHGDVYFTGQHYLLVNGPGFVDIHGDVYMQNTNSYGGGSAELKFVGNNDQHIYGPVTTDIYSKGKFGKLQSIKMRVPRYFYITTCTLSTTLR